MRVRLNQQESAACIGAASFSEPVTDFQTKAQRVSPDGVPLWDIHVTYLDLGEERPRPEQIRVRVPHQANPSITSATPVLFGGLKLNLWEIDGKAGHTWSADTFTTEAPPSTRRATKTADAPPPPSTK